MHPYLYKKMDDRIVSTAVLTLSRQQEEFLARYRTHEAQKAYFESYGLGVTPFFRGGGGSHGVIPPAPEPELPYDYAVEYLEVNEFSGVAYIDTLFSPNDIPYIIEAEFMILGWGVANGNTRIISWYNTNNEQMIMVRSNQLGNYTIMGQMIAASQNHIFNTDINIKYKIIIDRQQRSMTIGNESFVFNENILRRNDLTLLLFGNRTTNISYMRLYNFKLYNGSNLIFDMIPVSNNGIGFMYDKVSKTFFGAQGGGTFTIGPKI